MGLKDRVGTGGTGGTGGQVDYAVGYGGVMLGTFPRIYIAIYTLQEFFQSLVSSLWISLVRMVSMWIY